MRIPDLQGVRESDHPVAMRAGEQAATRSCAQTDSATLRVTKGRSRDRMVSECRR